MINYNNKFFIFSSRIEGTKSFFQLVVNHKDNTDLGQGLDHLYVSKQETDLRSIFYTGLFDSYLIVSQSICVN